MCVFQKIFALATIAKILGKMLCFCCVVCSYNVTKCGKKYKGCEYFSAIKYSPDSLFLC